MNLIKNLFLSSLFIFLLDFNAYSEDTDWQKDFQIDKNIGLVKKPWSIPFAKIKKSTDLAKETKKNLPPYSQQPQKAQKIIMSLSPDGR